MKPITIEQLLDLQNRIEERKSLLGASGEYLGIFADKKGTNAIDLIFDDGDGSYTYYELRTTLDNLYLPIEEFKEIKIKQQEEEKLKREFGYFLHYLNRNFIMSISIDENLEFDSILENYEERLVEENYPDTWIDKILNMLKDNKSKIEPDIQKENKRRKKLIKEKEEREYQIYLKVKERKENETNNN